MKSAHCKAGLLNDLVCVCVILYGPNQIIMEVKSKNTFVYNENENYLLVFFFLFTTDL